MKSQKYQGKEFTATLQAPDEKTLDNMISGLRTYAKYFEMGEVKILQMGTDPDGGYRADVVAHNFNPFKWFKRQKEKKGKSFEEKQRLERYYRRQDAVEKAEKKRKKKQEEAEKREKLKEEAEKRELEARIAQAKAKKKLAKKGYLTSSPPRISKRQKRVTRRMPKLR